MNKVSISAPGKLLILGDHAVVHGHPCLVVAIDRRFSLTAERIDKPVLQLNAPGLDLLNYEKPLDQLTKGEVPKPAEYIEYAVAQFISSYPFESGVKIDTAAGQMDAKFGFGTSAAATVATVKALSSLFVPKLNNRAIFDVSYRTVQSLKGVGSGFDMAAAAYGGFLYFVTAGKKITPISIPPFNLIVAYSGNKADTPTLVRAMQARIDAYPKIINGFFDVSEELVERGLQDLNKGDMESIGKLLSMHQSLLAAIGASTPQLDKICQVAVESGAYGAKLSGAGGGDCAIAIAPTAKIQSVIQALTRAGFETMMLEAGSAGVRVDKAA